jgi:hypothetical protein
VSPESRKVLAIHEWTIARKNGKDSSIYLLLLELRDVPFALTVSVSGC